MRVRSLAAALLTALPVTAPAVYLNPEGLGQALIYPYYTAQSAGGNAFNTYISVVNQAGDAKALRVRFREGRTGAEVASFNLFLPSNDAWTGAVIPALNDGARLVTRDLSCVDGDFALDSSPDPLPYLDFRSTLYTGAQSDGAGDGLDRTREGYVEILEMATLTGASAVAVAFDITGNPNNCAAVRTPTMPTVAAPTGGITGTLTLINVANGEDFTVNPDALAHLSTAPFYRPAGDPYPAFDAAEVTPLSAVSTGGNVYRSLWARGIDAVSAVFMRASWQVEYVLDAATRSLTDVVLTAPTRRYYAGAASLAPPFTGTSGWAAACGATRAGTGELGERLVAQVFDREERTHVVTGGVNDFGLFSPPLAVCASTTTFSVSNGQVHMVPGDASMVLGSINRTAILAVNSNFPNGWIDLAQPQPRTLTSLSNSTRINVSTGATTTGSHQFAGLPFTGMFVRVFQNGTLSCSGGACQGNYGGAFPLRYRRSIP